MAQLQHLLLFRNTESMHPTHSLGLVSCLLPAAGEPLLLQLLERCRVGVQADIDGAPLDSDPELSGGKKDPLSAWAQPLAVAMQVFRSLSTLPPQNQASALCVRLQTEMLVLTLQVALLCFAPLRSSGNQRCSSSP